MYLGSSPVLRRGGVDAAVRGAQETAGHAVQAATAVLPCSVVGVHVHELQGADGCRLPFFALALQAKAAKPLEVALGRVEGIQDRVSGLALQGWPFETLAGSDLIKACFTITAWPQGQLFAAVQVRRPLASHL